MKKCLENFFLIRLLVELFHFDNDNMIIDEDSFQKFYLNHSGSFYHDGHTLIFLDEDRVQRKFFPKILEKKILDVKIESDFFNLHNPNFNRCHNLADFFRFPIWENIGIYENVFFA